MLQTEKNVDQAGNTEKQELHIAKNVLLSSQKTGALEKFAAKCNKALQMFCVLQYLRFLSSQLNFLLWLRDAVFCK